MNQINPLHETAGGPSAPLLRHHTSIFFGDCADVLSGGGDISDSSSSISDSDSFSAASAMYDGFATLSWPIFVLEFAWNLAFIVSAVAVLLFTLKERPPTPLRLWLSGYALQCAFHIGFRSAEHQRTDSSSLLLQEGRLTRRIESVNAIISSVWWVIGFYWIVMGGQALLQDSPLLYWLTILFLVFDVVFVFFCMGTVFIVFCVLYCCIPIIALMYAFKMRPEGASKDIIRNLPRHRYRSASSLDAVVDCYKKGGFGTCLGASIHGCSTSELVLLPENSECCICLSLYVNGEELRTLPCNHHFHCDCISTWLQINATCPLCKYDILRRDSIV
ncbi:hypothetical protein SAY87_031385 [Trapa incisa]|uniref:RING-type E3 ubiquitin transferase n=1 Tax=Trapa incisa TaxID=236973 RepID=A0AAN7QN16_9MYRT|nr:hypothetical protein SAY87_031385 [Trapa incisa]